MVDTSQHVEFFAHARIVIGMIIGLGITRTLLTFANIIQHPHVYNRSALHLLWLTSMLTELSLFWYGHFDLIEIADWPFGLFMFFSGYAIALFLLVALLSPDRSEEYSGYEGFFIKRRHWFFGLLALTMVLDIFDSFFMYQQEGIDFYDLVPALFFLPLCALGWYIPKKHVQYAIVTAHCTYLVVMIGLFSFEII